MAKVTIVVPIYNVEKYLPKCLDSLINQTFKDIEIWAISDGSPDNSVQIIKEYEKKDSRIKCIEKENGGYGSVLEYATRNIKTDYFLICDPDDWLKEDAIEKLYKLAETKKVDLVVGAKYLVYNDNNENVYNDSIAKNVDIEIKPLEIYNQGNGFEKSMFITPSPHSKLYKTEKARDIKFPHKVSFTDFLLYTVYLTKCESFVYTDEALSYYLVDRPGNSMTDVNPKVFDYHAIVFETTMKQVEKHPVKYIYSHLLNHLRYILLEFKNMQNKKEKQKRIDKMYSLLQMCQNHRKEINDENSIFPKKVARYNKLLLNRVVGKYFYKRFVK